MTVDNLRSLLQKELQCFRHYAEMPVPFLQMGHRMFENIPACLQKGPE